MMMTTVEQTLVMTMILMIIKKNDGNDRNEIIQQTIQSATASAAHRHLQLQSHFSDRSLEIVPLERLQLCTAAACSPTGSKPKIRLRRCTTSCNYDGGRALVLVCGCCVGSPPPGFASGSCKFAHWLVVDGKNLMSGSLRQS
jgi:hypothetical protein